MRVFPHSRSADIDPEKRLRLAICIAMALVTVLVYARAVRFEFINYDDPLYVLHNETVRAGLTWKGFVWAFTQVSAAANWHPLTWLSHMLDCQLFGLNPAGPHAVNILFHTANSVLLFLLILKLTGKTWRSAIIAAVFALHPAHVESVAWIAERKDVLSTFFGFGSIIAYFEWTKQRRRASLLFALILYALSLMAKGMLVTLPFLLLLLDYWPLRRLENSGLRTFLGVKFRELVFEKWPWFLAAAAFSIITFYAQKTTGAVAPTQAYSLSFTIGNTFTAYCAYVRELLWPMHLSVFYPLSPYRFILRVSLAALALFAASGLAFLQSRRRPFLFTGWFWFVGTLVPVIGLVQVGSQAMADRYTYFPSIGLFVVVVWTVAEALEQIKVGRQVAVAATVVALFFCSVATFLQLQYWQNSLTLFSRNYALVGENPITLNNMAVAYSDVGDEEKSIYFYRRAVALEPGAALTEGNLGKALLLTKHPAEALQHLDLALKSEPTNASFQLFYGNALVKLGKPEAALDYFHAAIRLKKDFAQPYSDLGITLVELGRVQEGISNLHRALLIDTNFIEACNNLGATFIKQKKIDEAIGMCQKALQIDPTNVVAHYNLGLAQDKLGKPDDAITNFQVAVQADKKHIEARYELGRHLFLRGDWNGSKHWLEEAVRLKPEHAQAHLYLGLSQYELGQETNALPHLRQAAESLTNSLEAVNGLAWVLATANDPSVRNPKQAVTLAESATTQTQRKQPAILHTLAAAYAADDRFSEALATARLALHIAQRQNMSALATRLDSEIQHYGNGQPLYHDKP